MSKFLFEVSNIGKAFPNEKHLFQGASFRLPSRGLFAIAGKSGSGKSTLLSLLAGLDAPSEGTILFRGKNLAKMSKEALRKLRLKSFGFVFQRYELFEELSFLDNARLLSKLSHRKVDLSATLKRMGISHLEGKDVSRLSGGEKQRLATARALGNDPEVLFCDEPTGALDERNGIEVMRLLKEISTSRLVLMVSHNEELMAEYADGILRLQDGRVSSLGDIVEEKKPNKRRTPLLFSSWKQPFARSWSRAHFGLRIMRSAALFLGVFASYISASFFTSFSSSFDEAFSLSLRSRYLSFSMCEEIPISGSPLNLQKEGRPSLELTKSVLGESAQIGVDFSFLLGPGLFPIISKEEPKKGRRIENYYEVYANEAYVAEKGEGAGQIIEATLISNNLSERFEEHIPFEIVGVVEDNKLKNEPLLYYSYPLMEEFFSIRSLPLLSLGRGKETTVSSLLWEEANQNGQNAFLLFGEKEELQGKMKRLEGDKSYRLTSAYFEEWKAEKSLYETLMGALFFLLGEALLGVTIIYLVSSLSLRSDHEREIGLLDCLGAKKSAVLSIFSSFALKESLFSGMGAIALASLTEVFLSRFISKEYGLPHLFGAFSFPKPLLFLAGALLIATLPFSISTLFSKKSPLFEALKDE